MLKNIGKKDHIEKIVIWNFLSFNVKNMEFINAKTIFFGFNYIYTNYIFCISVFLCILKCSSRPCTYFE